MRGKTCTSNTHLLTSIWTTFQLSKEIQAPRAESVHIRVLHEIEALTRPIIMILNHLGLTGIAKFET